MKEANMLNAPVGATVSKQCRACLAATEDLSDCFIDLLEPIYFRKMLASSNVVPDEALTYLDCFVDCTQLDVSSQEFELAEDAGCRYLCRDCSEALCIAYKFIDRARQSDRIIKNLVQMKIEKLPEKVPLHSPPKEVRMLGVHESAGTVKSEREIEVFQELTMLPTVDNESYVDEVVSTDSFEYSKSFSTEFVLTGSEKNWNTHEAQTSNTSPEGSVKDFSPLLADTDGEEKDTAIRDMPLNETLTEMKNDDDEDRQHFFKFNCELCTATFDFQRRLMEHYVTDHTNEKLNFPCDSCENSFITKNALRIHKRQIHEKCEYIDCKQCGHTVLRSFFAVHQKRHNEKHRLMCSMCPNTFTSKYTLKKHLKLHSAPHNRNYECGDCNRKFVSFDKLVLHQEVHIHPQERKTFTCTLCDKTFLRHSTLKTHMQMHRGNTTDCPHCGKKFVRRVDLEVHIRFHTGDFPYACSLCDKKFAIKGHLTYHERKHSGVRYKCCLCVKEFLNKSGLKQHSYEHTGMPFTCKLCLRGFPTKFKIRRHLRRKHKDAFEGEYSDSQEDALILQNMKNVAHIAANYMKMDYLEKVEILEEHEGDVGENMLLK